VQTNGSLAQTSLASLLETMQAERATGTLSVRRGDTACSLYFLFGHLFHAAGDLGQGEEAVIAALTWSDGQFNFDPRAKLPAEETIKAATADLLSEAERRGAEAPSNGAVPELQPYTAPVTTAPAASAPLPDAEIPPAQTTVPEATAPAPEEPAPVAWSAPAEPAVDRRTEAPPLTATAQPALAPGQVFGNPNAEPLAELYPLPSGKAIYEGLKSAFVDFPKLLRTLDGDKHTGYVRLSGSEFNGVLLLHDGHVLDSLFSDGAISQGMEAFQKLRLRMEKGEGLLDVIELSGETVVALAQLLTAPPLFTGLLGRFINFDALLEYLAEERVDGSLVVAGGPETGVILLRKGAILGAYTQSHRDLAATPAGVTSLANERTARIEVKSGASSSPEGIDVEAALRVIY
jgi:uncharacterized protein DUF4388